MKKVNLTKYGFERSKEDDFSDDGNYFICYRHPDAPNIRISKLTDRGTIYLSSSVKDLDIDYDDYKDLEGYHFITWELNPIEVDSLTDEMLDAFTKAVIKYNKLCIEASKNAYQYTQEEIEKKYEGEHHQAIEDKATLNEIFELKIKKAMFNPNVSVEKGCLKYGLEYFKKAVKEVENILNRNKDQFIQDMMKKTRLQKKYYVLSSVRSCWYIKYANDYLDEAIRV